MTNKLPLILGLLMTTACGEKEPVDADGDGQAGDRARQGDGLQGGLLPPGPAVR